MTIMTRWRIYILLVLLAVAGTVVLAARLLRRRGVPVSRVQELLFLAGTLLTVETVIVAGLSNFNLGVILPAVFGVPLMGLAVLLPFAERGVCKALKWVVIGGYIAAGLVFSTCGILMATAARDADKVEADAVIVLGAAVHGDRVTWVLSNRLDAAKSYLDGHPGAVAVVSGGQGPGESVTEGSAMKKYLEENGIAPERVYAEERATNTSENFLFSKAIIGEACGPDARIAFVTTDFHVFRAGRVGRALGVDAAGIAASDVWYLRLNNFMRETVGICVYWLRGQL